MSSFAKTAPEIQNDVQNDFKSKQQNLYIEVISALLILLFLYTATSKLLNIESFKSVLSQSPLIVDYEDFVTIPIPTIEIVLSILLFIPKTRLWGLYGSMALMFLFTLYVAYMLLFEPNLPCSCGGIISKMSWPQHLIFNIVFTLLALTGIILHRKKRTT